MSNIDNILQTQNGAALFVQWLTKRQIKFVFLVPGAQIAPVLDVLATMDQIQVIVASHELGAAYMADGYARATKKVAVCISIGCPGSTNMLTAAVAARLDNSRVLFITGNVPLDLQGIGAFQDGGSNAGRDNELFHEALGYTTRVTKVDELSTLLNQAWDTMLLNTAPCHIAIANNIFTQYAAFSCEITEPVYPQIAEDELHQVINAINKAKKIVVIVGHRIYTQESAKLLKFLAKTYALPLVTTLAAKGVMPEVAPFNFGNFGYGGNASADAIVFTEKVDLLLILGTDLNEKDTLGWSKRLNPADRVLVRIDSIATPALHPYQPDIELIADSFSVLLALTKADAVLGPLRDSATYRRKWLNTVTKPELCIEKNYNRSKKQVIPLVKLIKTVQQLLPDDSILVADAGTHRQLSGCYWQVRQPDTYFNAATTAPMGWGIAAAIGIQLAQQKQKVIALTGDGCMRMHSMELATAARYQIPVVFIICNNAAYACTGSYLQAQNWSILQLPAIDWVVFAAAIGIDGIKINQLRELELAIKHARTINKPYLIEVITPSLLANGDN